MTSKRDVALFMVQALDQTDCHQEMVDLMKEVIDLNPVLSPDEQNLLNIAYKNIITEKRAGLSTIASLIAQEEAMSNQIRLNSLYSIKQDLIEEIDQCCRDIKELIDAKLLPNAKDKAAQVFYHKLKGDYFRYQCENHEDQIIAGNAHECYEAALQIAKDEMQPANPQFLGLILNYSVFLYDILGQKQRAIEMAEGAVSDSLGSLEDNNEREFQEATMILQTLKGNIITWKSNE